MTQPTTTRSYAGVAEAWVRAMLRASRCKTYSITPTLYAAASKSEPGKNHAVTLSTSGQIVGCTCAGWRGRTQPCRHAGAVAKRLSPHVCRKAISAFRAKTPDLIPVIATEPAPQEEAPATSFKIIDFARPVPAPEPELHEPMESTSAGGRRLFREAL